jgi:hypothetical protein
VGAGAAPEDDRAAQAARVLGEHLPSVPGQGIAAAAAAAAAVLPNARPASGGKVKLHGAGRSGEGRRGAEQSGRPAEPGTYKEPRCACLVHVVED